MANGNFNVSQELEILPPKTGKAYPVGLKDWIFLKNKIKEIKIEINKFHTIGFLLLGASISSIITILATKFVDNESKYLSWSIFVTTLICGSLAIYFSDDKHKQESAKPTEVLSQMNLIESRFETQEEV